jgi:PAS domain S-box-containing protein
LGCNSSYEKFFGKKKEQIIGKSVYELSPKEFADIYHEKDRVLLQNPGIQIYESTVKDTVGVVHNVIFHKATFPNMDGSVGGLIGGILDITDRKWTEEALRNSEARLHTLVQTIPDLIWLKDKDGVYLSCNTMFERFFGAMETDIVGKTDYDFVDRELANSFREHDGKAMAAGKTTSNEEWITFADDGHRAFLDTIKTPMYDAKGTIIGVLGIGRDITNRRSVERIRKALGATVQAIAVIVETRDPYTAGHQRRVADLARSIATEMHLPDDQIDGIRMAATIHDLGKISVPAEILSKPTKLKKTEFDLIKEHSQSGYDILKDIDFPWPVARIVLEHHEKINGSGYPNGLAGDNILLESRIIAVADVVESMSSHRPYRPSLGIEAALEEIEKNRGIFYDDAVADACLRLFREKGFKLEGS